MAREPGRSGVHARDAVHRGDLGTISVTAPVVDIAVTPDGNGYWLVTSEGIVYAFGSALWRGSLGHLDLQAPVVDLEPVSTGYGYWLTAADGGVFAFGDAEYLGGLADHQLYRPIIDLLSSPDGSGYLLVGADGAVRMETLALGVRSPTTRFPAIRSSLRNKLRMGLGIG